MQMPIQIGMSLPIVVSSLSEGFSKFYEKCNDKNIFNVILTPNSSISRLYAHLLDKKIPKQEIIHIGGSVPDHITNKMLKSLEYGGVHYLISTIYLLMAAIEAYPNQLHPLDFFSSDNAKLYIWLIEPELMDPQQFRLSVEFGAFTKHWAPKAQQTINFVLSKESMNYIPMFNGLLSKYSDNELKLRLLSMLGIKFEMKESNLYINI